MQLWYNRATYTSGGDTHGNLNRGTQAGVRDGRHGPRGQCHSAGTGKLAEETGRSCEDTDRAGSQERGIHVVGGAAGDGIHAQSRPKGQRGPAAGQPLAARGGSPAPRRADLDFLDPSDAGRGGGKLLAPGGGLASASASTRWNASSPSRGGMTAWSRSAISSRRRRRRRAWPSARPRAASWRWTRPARTSSSTVTRGKTGA